MSSGISPDVIDAGRTGSSESPSERGVSSPWADDPGDRAGPLPPPVVSDVQPTPNHPKAGPSGAVAGAGSVTGPRPSRAIRSGRDAVETGTLSKFEVKKSC